MAENSRMSKLSEKEDECIFSWKLFTGWDFMIGNTETAHNRIASVILGFKEALLEEAEKKKDLRNWRIISLRALVNICVIILLAVSAFAVVTVVSRSDDNLKVRSWWRENETTIVVTMISITFPVFFELLGFLEHYHPRKQLRLQLARIMLLNLLNLYSLIFALFSKIEGMSKELDLLKPNLTMNATTIPNGTLNISESMVLKIPSTCIEEKISCEPCSVQLSMPIRLSDGITIRTKASAPFSILCVPTTRKTTTNQPTTIKNVLRRRRQTNISTKEIDNITLAKNIQLGLDELKKLNSIVKQSPTATNIDSEKKFYVQPEDIDAEDYEYSFYDETTTDITDTSTNYPSTTVDITTDLSSTQDNIYTETDIFTTETTYTPFDDSTYVDAYSDTTYESTYSSPFDTTTYSSDKTSETLFETTPTDSIVTITDANTESDATDGTGTVRYITVSDILETSTPYVATRATSLPNTVNIDSTTELETESAITTTLTVPTVINSDLCPNISFNCTLNCSGEYVTQVFFISNCNVVDKVCYRRVCTEVVLKNNETNIADAVYEDEHKRKVYNLTKPTRKKLLKLCWETMFGQELVKLTMMDLVFVLLGTLFTDFFRALLVRYLNRCWCWDLEKKFPEYGDFKIAENILHLINNQGMVWMGMFFSPGLVVLNVVKLMIMMYLRSWAVMTCNVPHEVVFRVSKSNNFYLALLLTMLFLCVLPVGYTIVWVKPSWHCGPFSEYDKIYYILTINIYKLLPGSLNFAIEYIASPAIVIPLLVLLILIIYYLTSLTNSLREANNDLKIQLRRERTEERRKMFQLADTRRRAGSSAMENTPFARWKKALPSLPMSKSIDSDDRKTLTEETVEPVKVAKKRGKDIFNPGGIFAKIVGMALDKKTDVDVVPEIDHPPSQNTVDDETDTDFHENLPREVLKIKDISIIRPEPKKKNSVEFKTDEGTKYKNDDSNLKVKLEKDDDRTEKKAIIEKQIQDAKDGGKPKITGEIPKERTRGKKFHEKQTSESSTQSRQSDSIGSVIPVITISTTESDEEVLSKKEKKSKNGDKDKPKQKSEGKPRRTPDLKSLRRQSSVESINEQKPPTEEKREDGHKYQYSL